MTLRRPPSTNLASANSSAELIARSCGLRTRDVVLDENWWAHDIGPLVAKLVGTGQPVAIIGPGPGRYVVVDPATKARARLDRDVAGTIAPGATMLYRPLPNGALRGREHLEVRAPAHPA